MCVIESSYSCEIVFGINPHSRSIRVTLARLFQNFALLIRNDLRLIEQQQYFDQTVVFICYKNLKCTQKKMQAHYKKVFRSTAKNKPCTIQICKCTEILLVNKSHSPSQVIPILLLTIPFSAKNKT